MMLKLVNDISSVEATLQSNHTLQKYLSTAFSFDEEILQQQINYVTRINKQCGDNAEAAGREKMIHFQLHSEKRSVLAELQKVHQSIYSEINPLNLPEVLSLLGHRHGQSSGEIIYSCTAVNGGQEKMDHGRTRLIFGQSGAAYGRNCSN